MCKVGGRGLSPGLGGTEGPTDFSDGGLSLSATQHLHPRSRPHPTGQLYQAFLQEGCGVPWGGMRDWPGGSFSKSLSSKGHARQRGLNTHLETKLTPASLEHQDAEVSTQVLFHQKGSRTRLYVVGLHGKSNPPGRRGPGSPAPCTAPRILPTTPAAAPTWNLVGKQDGQEQGEWGNYARKPAALPSRVPASTRQASTPRDRRASGLRGRLPGNFQIRS